MPVIFEATTTVRFDDLAGGTSQRIFDFGNGTASDNILFGQVGTSSTMRLETWVGGVAYTLDIANAIVEGETATWRTTIADDGTFEVYKDGILIGSQTFGVAAVPADVVRTSNLIGESNTAGQDPLIGEISSVDVETTFANAFDVTISDAVNYTGTFDGSDGDDTIDASGTTTGVLLRGDGGDDVLMGGSGDDTLEGGNNSDTITGGDGNDLIDGGGTSTGGGVPGIDYLDTIFFNTATGDIYAYDTTDGSSTLLSNAGGIGFGDIAMTADGRLFGITFADFNDLLYEIDPATGAISVAHDLTNIGAGLAGLTIGPDGNLYIGQNNGDIQMLSPDGSGGWTEEGIVLNGAGSIFDILFLDTDTAWVVNNGAIIEYDVSSTGVFSNATSLGTINGQTDIFGISQAADGRVYVFEGTAEVTSTDPTVQPLVWTSEPNATGTIYGATSVVDAGNTTGELDGADSLSGEAGSDTIFGGAANDTLDGGADNDLLDGGTGNDQIAGGTGSDTVQLTDGFGQDTVVGGEDGGDTDVLDASALSNAADLNLSGAEGGTLTSDGNSVTFDEIESIVLTDQNESIDLAGTNSNIAIDGGGGDDLLTGSDGGAAVAGVDYANSIFYNTDNGDIYAYDTTDGSTTLLSNAGGIGFGDIAMGADGRLYGVTFADADDLIYEIDVATGGITVAHDLTNTSAGLAGLTIGPDGNMYIGLNNGDIEMLSPDGSGGWTEEGTVLNGSGVIYDLMFIDENTAWVVNAGSILQFDVDANGNFTNQTSLGIINGQGDIWGISQAGDGRIYVFEGTSEVSSTDPTVQPLVWTSEPNATGTIYGATSVIDAGNISGDLSGADNLSGGAGNDTLQGLAGDDTLDGGADDDTVEGGAGNDSMLGGSGNDSLTGGDGDDTLIGGTGDDTLVAGNNTGAGDSLVGGTGNDVLTDSFFNATLEGGDDADLFNLGFGTATVTGGEGGTDSDTISFSTANDPVTITLTGNEQGTYSDSDGDSGQFTEIEAFVLTDGDDSLDGTASTDVIDVVAGDGNDTLIGGSAADTFQGGLGNDSVDGGLGADTLVDGLGADTLLGGQGNDLLISENAGDAIDQPQLLDGGAGEDTIRIEGDFTAQDTIVGGTGTDELQLLPDDDRNLTVDMTTGITADGTTGAQEFSEIENITTGGGDDTITGDGQNNVLNSGSGADSIDAGGGHDTLNGGTGDDVLTGGTGNDTFVYTPGDGLDTITDFNTGATGTLFDGDTTNNDFIDLSAYYDRIFELWADQADDGILNQSNSIDTQGNPSDYSDNTQFAPGEGLVFTGATPDISTFTFENTGVVCFTSGTLIRTPKGPRPIEQLQKGDLIVTRDNGVQPLLGVNVQPVGPDLLDSSPTFAPVLLKAQAFGFDRDLIVSQQHGVLLRSGECGGDEVLFRAKHLAQIPGGGARIMWGRRMVTYVHLLFEEHQIVFANGAASESLYPGKEALRGLGEKALQNVLGHLPALGSGPVEETYGLPAVAYSRRGALPEHLRALRAVR
jgi:Ca2+-binding RTX toxin-like protein